MDERYRLFSRYNNMSMTLTRGIILLRIKMMSAMSVLVYLLQRITFFQSLGIKFSSYLMSTVDSKSFYYVSVISIMNSYILLKILSVCGCSERFSKERVCIYSLGNVPASMFTISIRLWKVTTFFGKRSVVSLSCSDWLLTSTYQLMTRLGIIIPSLRRRKRVREESSSGTVVLALLSVRSFASITLFD